MKTRACGWLLTANVIMVVFCSIYWQKNFKLRGDVTRLETEASALQACMPQAEGDISAMARREGLLECAMTTRGNGRRKDIARFSYKT